jgi:hypothetical protein
MLLERIAQVRRQCPELRFGQILATVGLLAEDDTGHSLWDVEDGEFAAALERFASDLARRGRAPSELPHVSQPIAKSVANGETSLPLDDVRET